MAESTSTLQAKLKALTHGKVDIMLDPETFKSTTQILREMAGAWEYMTDIERASALELMGGKRQANILSSLISNYDIVENVIQTSTNSANSALEENAKYLDSMQGRIDQLKNSIQSMWVNAMDSETMKSLISFVDKIVQAIDKLGLLNVALGAIMAKIAFGGKNAKGFGIANLFTSVIQGADGATKGITLLGKALPVASTGFKIFNAAATMGVSLLAGALIGALVKYASEAIKTAEEIKQEAKEISEAYADAVDEINNNFKSLGIENESSSISALEKEFATLAAGVDKYGNNISLTSDQYERYRDICEQIVGINPLIASGYDSATEAIGNNASVLSQLIELQREQARIAAEEYFSDENIEILTKDAVNDYRDIIAKNNSSRAQAFATLGDSFNDPFEKYLESNTDVENTLPEKWKWILTQIGYEAEKAEAIVDSYKNYYGNLDGEEVYMYDNSFFEDYADEIKANISNFGAAYESEISKAFVGAETEFAAAEKRLKEAQDGLIDTLLIAPASSRDYGKLTSEGKNFLVEWIKNNEMFKVTGGDLTEDQVQAMKDTVLSMMDILVSSAKTVEYNGKMFTAQDILSKIYNIDASSVDYAAYKNQVNEMLTAFWNSLTDQQKIDHGFTSFENFTISLGFDFVAADQTESEMINRYAEIKGITEEQARIYFGSLPAAVVKRLLLVDWNLVDENNIDDTISGAKYESPDSSQTYSVLAESVEKYNDALTQTLEIASDNTEVTQEYKDLLVELGVSTEELNECFDEQNPLIVKNAKALNQLVKTTSKNTAENVKLAKSNARLDYYKLVKQLNDTLKTTKNLNDATRDSVYATLEQIDVVERALYKYQLLEDSLLGVNNAFDEFAKAKEIDELNTYGESYVEMVQTMYDALYKTGQVGTESFWSSVEHLVPTEVYQHLTEDADRMKAIYDYYNKNILPSLQLKDDEFSIDYASVENFVNKGLGVIFEGNKEKFDLVEGLNLEEAAELMGMTKAQAYAFFAELDKYNVAGNEHSFLSQLDDSLEGRITNITNGIEDLNRQKLALLEDGGYDEHKEAIDEINQKLAQSKDDLNALGQEAYETWEKYTKNEAVIAALESVEDKTRYLSETGAKQLGLEWEEVQGKTIQQTLDILLAKKLQLGEPTELTATLAIETIDSEIAVLEEKIASIQADPTIVINPEQQIAQARQKIQELKNDKVELATQFNIELTEEEKKDLQSQLNAIQAFTIEDKTFNVVANGAQERLQELKAIRDFALKNKSYTVSEYKNTYRKAYVYDPAGGKYVVTNFADGTAHVNGTAYKGGSWGAPKTETALVGELGPEMLVRNGRWTTIGDNGAEFTQIKKGDIIFNHKQTEDLLSKGYVTGRGKLAGGSSAFADGTAYSGLWKPTSPNKPRSNKPGHDFSDTSDKLSNAASSVSDAADEFREVFDWIEVRLEEINDAISFGEAQLENQVGYSNQNKVVDEIIDLNQRLYDNLIAGANKYYSYAEQLLAKVPEEYREAAQDGTISIEEFVGKADEKTLEAIKEYREWVQKGDEAAQQAEATLTRISDLAKQAIDNIAQDYDNQHSLSDNQINQYEAYNELLETDQGFESEAIYQAMINENNAMISGLEQQRDTMLAELNKRVESGEIQVGSQDWYDAINDIAAVDEKIIKAKTDTENWQDAINDLHWKKFDALMGRIEAVSEEAENLIDILGNKDMFDESGNWTDEGITSLGLYAQQMEAAEVQAKKYEEEIAYLNENWQALGYTEEEYIEKLGELKGGQYDAIQAYHDNKEAIVDLNKERVAAIKNGIEKEIKAYEDLINKKKEELDAEKDLYDFQKSVMEQEKDIADLERQLAALSGDNSASARAKRAQLEAELAEAQAELQDSYYERSISNQQEALDKELESFQDEKDKEMEGWNEYLENTEQVVADSLETVQANTETVYTTLQAMGEEYGLSITESLTSPWEEGSNAIQSFSEQFGISMSATVEELMELEQKFKDTMLEIEGLGEDSVDEVIKNAEEYISAQYQEPNENDGPDDGGGGDDGDNGDGGPSNAGLVSSLSGYIRYGNRGENVKKLQKALNDLGYGNSGTSGLDGIFGDKTLAAVKKFQKDMGISADGIVGPETKKKFKTKGYAKGTTSLNKSGIINVDELGDELLVHAQNGRLVYMEKGSGIVPADLTENLMGWGKLDPSIMLDQNRPQVGLHPEIHNTQIQIDNSIAELIHIDNCSTETLPDVKKIVNEALEKHTQKLNQSLRKYTR